MRMGSVRIKQANFSSFERSLFGRLTLTWLLGLSIGLFIHDSVLVPYGFTNGMPAEFLRRFIGGMTAELLLVSLLFGVVGVKFCCKHLSSGADHIPPWINRLYPMVLAINTLSVLIAAIAGPLVLQFQDSSAMLRWRANPLSRLSTVYFGCCSLIYLLLTVTILSIFFELRLKISVGSLDNSVGSTPGRKH
jgi:hypothetical protein